MSYNSISETKSFWNRNLDYYPENRKRIWYLSVSVLVTIVLYYQYYVLAAVAPLVMEDLKMSLDWYAYLWVVANGLGAISSLIGGFADKIGRANFVVYGVLVSAILTFSLIFTSSVMSFSILFCMLGFVEGVLLVATPALVRDFSPRLGRATAMAFWSIGPVGGSLLTTFFANQTLPIYGTWESQFIICTIFGVIVFFISLFGLKELSPAIRNQIMVSVEESAKVLAQSKGNDTEPEASQKRPWTQMLSGRLIGSAFAISVFLLLYYSAVGYFPLYLTTIYTFTLEQANGMMTLFWLAEAVGLVTFGMISDKLQVRKPFMIVGAIGMAVGIGFFIANIGQPATVLSMSVLLSFMALMIGLTYAPWMASYTETVEDINPSFVATGVAIWGSLIRWVVVAQGLLMPHIIGTPEGWGTWWKICMAGAIVFIPFVFGMSGFWTKKKAEEARNTVVIPENAG